MSGLNGKHRDVLEGAPPAPGYNEVIQPGSDAAEQLRKAAGFSFTSLFNGSEVKLGSRTHRNGMPVEPVYNDLFAEEAKQS